MLTWVVGAGGLFGSALVRATDGVEGASHFHGSAVPWLTPDARSVLASETERFQRAAGDGTWAVYWAAGSAVVASNPTAMSSELGTLTALLEALRIHRPAGPGAVFLSSSAGGAYGGSVSAPFGASSPAIASGPYGELKLAQEALATTLLAGVVPLIIGRIANLYGPGQNPDKPQGLVHALCRAAAQRRALNLYVPLDTLRDYVYADDAAHAARGFVADATARSVPDARIVVIGSGRAVSIGELVSTVIRVTHRKVPIALGRHPSASQQARDLRLVPTASASGDAFATTSLDVGVRRTFDAIVGQPAPN